MPAEAVLESHPLSLIPSQHPQKVKAQSKREEHTAVRVICNSHPSWKRKDWNPASVCSGPRKAKGRDWEDHLYSALPGWQARDASVLVLLHIDCLWEGGGRRESLFLCRCLWGHKSSHQAFPGDPVVGITCQCRGCRSNPWCGQIPHATEELSPCTTTLRPTCPSGMCS